MLRPNPHGHLPRVHDSAFVDPTAILCGKIEVGPQVYIGPYAVVRADETDSNGEVQPIIIGANTNIQDGVVIHSRSGAAVTVGEFTSIAHRAIVHGPCVIGSRVFIGFNAVVFGVEIGNDCFVEHGAVVLDTSIRDGLHIGPLEYVGPNFDLTKLPQAGEEQRSFSAGIATTNIELNKGYRRLIEQADDSSHSGAR